MAQQAPMPGLAEILRALPSLKAEELRLLKDRMDQILQKDILLHLPQELQLCVLEGLNVDDIGACVHVSRSWRNLMQQEAVVTTLSRINYPGLYQMVQCRYDTRVAVTGNKPNQGGGGVLRTLHRRAYFKALHGTMRRRRGMFGSLYSHRWWHRSDPDEADGVERLLPADEWRGHFVLPHDTTEIFWPKDVTKYRRAPLPSPMPADLPPPEFGKARYHSGRLALQFDDDDPRGPFVVDYLSEGVRRRFQPPAQQVGSCNLLALGDTLMVCGRGNRLYVYNLLQPEQPCRSLHLPGLINQDCIATAGPHVVGMLSFHGSVKLFDWTADGHMRDYEVSEPTEYALEACQYLKDSHKTRLVAHPFAKGVMYLMFNNILTSSKITYTSGRAASSRGLKTVVFEIVDQQFRRGWFTKFTAPIDTYTLNGPMTSFGTPTDSHGSICIGIIDAPDAPDSDNMSDYDALAAVQGALLTFNIFARTFVRTNVWSNDFKHYWDGLYAGCYSHWREVRGLARIDVPIVVLASSPVREQSRYNPGVELYLSEWEEQSTSYPPQTFQVPVRCFPRLSPEQRESPAAAKDHTLPHPDDNIEELIDHYGMSVYPLYTLLSDADFHLSYGRLAIFGDDDFLIYIGDRGYAAWRFALEGDVPKKAGNDDQKPGPSLPRRNH
ncbi:hypothetical protein RB598_009343 [Gaeumannomyces tritici]